MTYLLLTVRFLDDRYHGLLDRGGPPEWPPFATSVVSGIGRGRGTAGELVIGDDVPSKPRFTSIGQALDWLQRHTREYPPIIIAPRSKTGQAITRFVPNNDGDRKIDRQERLTAKPTIATLFLLEPGQKPEVHYAWDIGGSAGAPVDRIRDAAHSLAALGWGIDMAFADANRADEAKLQSLKGIRWYPQKGAWRSEGMLAHADLRGRRRENARWAISASATVRSSTASSTASRSRQSINPRSSTGSFIRVLSGRLAGHTRFSRCSTLITTLFAIRTPSSSTSRV